MHQAAWRRPQIGEPETDADIVFTFCLHVVGCLKRRLPLSLGIEQIHHGLARVSFLCFDKASIMRSFFTLLVLVLGVFIQAVFVFAADYPVSDRNEDLSSAEETREVILLVPNVTCYGRFLDSFKTHLRDVHPWIQGVAIENTGRVKQVAPLTIGTVAKVTFTIDSQKTPKDLLVAIRTSRRYDLTHWTVRVEQAVLEILDGETD
jgi:hypothetical protein